MERARRRFAARYRHARRDARDAPTSSAIHAAPRRAIARRVPSSLFCAEHVTSTAPQKRFARYHFRPPPEYSFVLIFQAEQAPLRVAADSDARARCARYASDAATVVPSPYLSAR